MKAPLFHFDNSYSRLPKQFYERMPPPPVRAPTMAIYNTALAESLGLGAAVPAPEFFSGNALPAGAEPIAQAYAGHQFGHFNMLGDGRAVLLGEHLTPQGARFDIQLKGSGPTPFSRRGDGRAALAPMLREYVISEAMHAFGIPTTRSLAVVSTGETVNRDQPLPGAILTRVAASHIRVGTFEYAAASVEPNLVRTLAGYTLQRHFPELGKSDYLGLLRAVMHRQASLLAAWMNVGFIHGVMNTDNMALSGETIDYGPCAFMDAYSPATVFSSIDRQGRYAYGNQPRIAEWNLTRLAEALLPLLSEREEDAVAIAKETLGTFQASFQEKWKLGMRAKIGFTGEQGDHLIPELFSLMEKHEADFTNTFRALSSGELRPELADWGVRWKTLRPDLALMRSTNPAVIPRNHLVEKALESAAEGNDFAPLHRLLEVIQKPFEEADASFMQAGNEMGYQTFCGT
jgi:uncharacterized protein YdiU (UPF0061 family)